MHEVGMMGQESRSQLLAARLTSAAVIVLGLYVGKVVLIPLGLALLLAFMLQPAVRWLRKRGLPNAAAVALTAAVFFALLGLLAWVIAGQVRSLSSEIPKYRENLVSKVAQVRKSLRGGSIDTLKTTVTEVLESVEEKEREEAEGVPAGGAAEAQGPPPPREEELKPAKVVLAKEEGAVDELSSMAGVLSPLATAGLVVLLVVVVLLKWADLRGRLIALIGHNLMTTTVALDDAAGRVSRYLAMQFMVNAGTGLVVWAGLSLIGIPYAGLMGLCAGLFRYVPYAGPLAAAALPIVMSVATSAPGATAEAAAAGTSRLPGWLALVTSAEWGPVVAVVGMFVVLELVLNNVVEPWLYGSRLGVSELGIIMATVVWTFLWGPAGLVLATPLTVCLVVLGEKVSGLAFLSKLLSDRVHLPVHATLAQRLMAGDAIEAADILDTYRERASADETFDAVVVPALARMRHEQRLGHLDGAHAAAMAAALSPMMRDLAASEPEGAVALTREARLAVWSLCPMSDAVAALLPDRFRQVPCAMVLFNAQSLAADVMGRVREQPVLGIVLLHLDPSDYARATATLKRVRRTLPEVPILVGRWGEQPLSEAERGELVAFGATALVATPGELAAWVNPRALDVARPVPKTL